jgi:hypothetical protein
VWRAAARGSTGGDAADPDAPERVHRALEALSDRLGAVIPDDDRPCPVCGEAPDGHEHPTGAPG